MKFLNDKTHLTAIFQDKPGKPVLECHHSDVVGAGDDGSCGESCSYKTCISRPFYSSDTLAFAQPTASGHRREKVSHSTDLFTPGSFGAIYFLVLSIST